MKKYNHKETLKDYINYDDGLQKLGYSHYKPRLGSLGRALLKASNNQGRYSILKTYWDNYFRELRQKYKGKKQKNVPKQNG